jgi:DNA-binding transcriptional LysR family regulator
MNDLNNLFYFAKIVEHGSLSSAGEALGVAKSVLSQHLARLEADLGVRLIQRTTRRLQVTEIGQRYYQRCRAVLAEVERAASVIDDARGTPRGTLRLTSPVNFAQVILAPMLAEFMRAYPDVSVALDITNREVDLIAEGYDLALRIAPDIRPSTQIVRSFRVNRHILVASPSFIDVHGLPASPEALHTLPSIAGLHAVARSGRHAWQLTGFDGVMRTIAHHPRLVTEDIFVLKQVALAGCGVAELPPICCRDELADGSLVELLPGWTLPEMNLHAVFPSRTGMTHALRCFIDYLALQMDAALDEASTSTMRMSLVPGSLDDVHRVVG